MKYEGPLYGKIGRRFVPLTMTSQQVDALQAERDQISRDLSSLLAADCLNGHDAAEGAQNGIAMRKALEEAHEALLTFNDVGNCRAFHDAKDKALRIIASFLPIPETTSLKS